MQYEGNIIYSNIKDGCLLGFRAMLSGRNITDVSEVLSTFITVLIMEAAELTLDAMRTANPT
jgi:hypothetical protein